MTVSGCGETFQMLVRVKRNVRVRKVRKKMKESSIIFISLLIIISAIVFALQLSDVPKSQNIKCFKLLL